MTPLQMREMLAAAPTRADRAALTQKLAAQLNLSPGTILRKARQAGARANCTIRSDAGESGISPEHLKIIAGTVLRTRRLNGHIVAPVKGVVKMLVANGEIPPLAPSTYCRALRQAELSKREMSQKPTWRNRTSEPGQIFMLDSSGSLQWTFPKGEAEPLREIPATTQMRIYKPDVAANLKQQIKRYFVIDHASQRTAGRYIYTRGETAFDTLQTLIGAFTEMGVPRFLYIDKGPGNTAFEIKYFLFLLGIEIIWKGPEAHVLGRIDNVHNLVQTGLEWRFSLQPPTSIIEMNSLLSAWLTQLNCAEIHRTAKKTRHEMFLMAEHGILRLLPDPDALQAVQLARPETRNIDGRGLLSFHGRTFRTDRPDLFNTNHFVAVNPFAPATLLILKDFSAETLQCSERIEAREEAYTAFGLPASAVPLVHDHPIAARAPAFRSALKQAVAASREAVAARAIDPYADLRVCASSPISVHPSSSASSADNPSFPSAQLDRLLASATPIDLSDNERTFDPAAAIYQVHLRISRELGRDLTDSESAQLLAWREAAAPIKASEISAFLAAAKRPPLPQEKTA